MKPSIGRIVIYKYTEFETNVFTNGAKEAPAVVVRVWSDTCVNLKVLVDGNMDLWKTSVLVRPEIQVPEVESRGVWYWPERV